MQVVQSSSGNQKGKLCLGGHDQWLVAQKQLEVQSQEQTAKHKTGYRFNNRIKKSQASVEIPEKRAEGELMA